MSLYQALPPAHGQVAVRPSLTAASPLSSSKPSPAVLSFSRLLLPRPPVPRALLNLPSVKAKPSLGAATPSSSPGSSAPTPPTSISIPTASPPQSTVTVVPSLFDSTDDDGAEGDELLLQALAETTEPYDPRRPNEWEHFVAWKAMQTPAPPPAPQVDEEEEEGEEDARDAARARQRGFQFRYSYDDQRSSELDSQSPPRPPSPVTPPALPAPIAAPLSAKQEALATASGEDAYLRRMRLSAQPRPPPPEPHPAPAPLPRPPPPPFLPNPGPPPTTSLPSRVVLLTVAITLLCTALPYLPSPLPSPRSRLLLP